MDKGNNLPKNKKCTKAISSMANVMAMGHYYGKQIPSMDILKITKCTGGENFNLKMVHGKRENGSMGKRFKKIYDLKYKKYLLILD